MYNNYPYYNNIYGGGYYAQPQVQQPTQQQTQPIYSTQNTNQIFVNGIDDVKARPQPFNSTYNYTDNDKPKLYQKIVDSTGKFTVKAFDIVEENKGNTEENVSPINLSTDTITAEIGAIKGEIQALNNKLDKMFAPKEEKGEKIDG